MSTPERDPDSDARAWDEIVRQLQTDIGPAQTADPSGAGPAATSRPADADRGSSDAPSSRAPEAGGPPAPETSYDDSPSGLLFRPPGAAGPRDYELAPPDDEADPEDDWQPEDPGRVTEGMRPGTLMAWCVLLGVSVLMLVVGFALDGLPWWLWVPGLALVLGSLVSLFQSLPEQRSEYDDGAQV